MGPYITNIDEYESIGTHWIVLQFNIFKKKLENSLELKILQQVFTEYKHTI